MPENVARDPDEARLDNDNRPSVAQRDYEIIQWSAASDRICRQDSVVVEEPMEIRIVFGPREKRSMRNVSITMRTPGFDQELAVGFLMTESILDSPGQIEEVTTRGVDSEGCQTGNIIRVQVRPEIDLKLDRLNRNFFTTSSCGVCGKASLEALEMQGLQPLDQNNFQLDADSICRLPEKLRNSQTTFQSTGGLHGAGLIDGQGNLVDSREDVGRHNAVDKLLGRCFLDEKLPLQNYAMIVSGRVSFEITQKALVAGLPMIIAVGAPSSLAIDMANQYRLTLVGFTSHNRFNVYSIPDRIA